MRTDGVARRALGSILLIVLAGGCLTLRHPLPPANLDQPGWTVHQGQAIWTLPRGGHDIAGEVIVATGPQGSSFVQFSKSPFPLVVGQTTTDKWQIEFPPENKGYSGPGAPPRRLIWLYLPRSLQGKAPPPHWTWTQSESNWKLENHSTGEKIEGFFAQ